jgi:uncharacterized coiled-coil protein SlyX
MRLLIEVEGEEALELIAEFQGLIKRLEELSDEIAELRELVGAQTSQLDKLFVKHKESDDGR